MKPQLDPQGNPRTIPVRISDGRHVGLVVWHSPQEWRRLVQGVDLEAAKLLGSPSGAQPDPWRPTGECPEC